MGGQSRLGAHYSKSIKLVMTRSHARGNREIVLEERVLVRVMIEVEGNKQILKGLRCHNDEFEFYLVGQPLT